MGSGGVDHTHTTNVYHRHYIDGGSHNHDALWGNNNDRDENGVVGNCMGNRYQGTITRTDGSHTHWTNTGIYDNSGNYIGGNGTWDVNSGGASAYSHTHPLTINSDGETESRPSNYTIRVWKRIA